MRLLTSDETVTFLETMETFGGGFASALANAWGRADWPRRRRLEAAFPDLIADYGPGSSFYKEIEQRYAG